MKSSLVSKGNQTFTVQTSKLSGSLNLKTHFYDVKDNRGHYFTFSLDCKMHLLCFHDLRRILRYMRCSGIELSNFQDNKGLCHVS